jgi:hypothetical protein
MLESGLRVDELRVVEMEGGRRRERCFWLMLFDVLRQVDRGRDVSQRELRLH